MKRPFIFIVVLMSLFIFQSLWNVAAAFCQHESSVNHGTHFGHHQSLTSCVDEHQIKNHTASDTEKNIQDHHDHLPSLSHILIIEIQKELIQSTQFNLSPEPLYVWLNLYQSPDLIAINPPPLAIPLLVG